MKRNKKDVIRTRVMNIAGYVVETQDNIRHTSKIFSISKSTVHKDLSERLPRINPQLYGKVKSILIDNKYMGQLKGGEATSKRYRKAVNS